jgi:phenylalanyl-tRNA synthetase beta chain
MRVSLNWLKEYVDIELAPRELGQLLTMRGLEVETVEPLGHSLEGVVVGKLLAVEPHPHADRLSLCQVDAGRERVQVVCSAPNLQVGTAVPLALPGVKLPDGTVIEESRIREETSQGMLLAEDEMGLTEDHTGVMVLDTDVEPGTAVIHTLGLPDWVLEIDITPNRPDCACVLGIAREIAAATGKELRKPQIRITQEGPPVDSLTGVTLVDSLGCPRYAAGVIQGVQLGPTPFRMRCRLHASGVRSINNIVDVTNYVMLEMNQPLHAFDYHRLREHRIVVRRAERDEKFTTLDGQTHTLNEETLLICDGQRPVAVAGIMGGLNSEIFEGTDTVLLESAFFDPIIIRRGSRGLGLSTEASYRFERGTDIEGVIPALNRAMNLISDLAGGSMAAGVVDNYPNRWKAPEIVLSTEKTNRFLGTSLPLRAISGYLRSLELEVQDVNTDQLKVKPPGFRVDLRRDVDLMEEVARLSGYDSIPVTYPQIRPSEKKPIPELALRDEVRHILTGMGFTEVITYSFVSPESTGLLGDDGEKGYEPAVRIMNPLTIDQSVMRTSLLPGIMETIAYNSVRGMEGLKIFEWGKVFLAREGDQQPAEKICLAAAVFGTWEEQRWYGKARESDFYDIKGAVEGLLEALGVGRVDYRKGMVGQAYHGRASAGIYCDEDRVGQVGQVSKKMIGYYDFTRSNIFLFEMDVPALLKHIPVVRRCEAVARFPAVYRDISLVVNRMVECDTIIKIIQREGGDLVESVQLFDMFEGGALRPSERSMGFRICYRSRNETLEGSEVNRLHDAIVRTVRDQTGGKLREG